MNYTKTDFYILEIKPQKIVLSTIAPKGKILRNNANQRSERLGH